MKLLKPGFLALFLAVSAFIQWEAHRLDADAPTSGLIGQPAPSFGLVDLEGEEIRLEDLRGQFVLVDFWATWCGPCRRSMPVLEAFADSMGDRLTLLSVNLAESEESVRAYAEQHALKSRILLDPEGDVAVLYGVRSIPMQILIDPEGMVRDAVVGYSPLTIFSMEAKIDTWEASE